MKKIDEQDLSRIIEMAWEDRTPFEAIEREYGLRESEVIRLMRYNLKTNSFKLWRKRMAGRKTSDAGDEYFRPETNVGDE